MREEWVEIPEFPDYVVNRSAEVANIKTGIMISPRPNQGGHIRVGLMLDGRQVTRSLAVIVASAFIPRPDSHFNTPIHRDGDLWNCRADNLLWRPRPFAILFHKQFRLDTFHTNYILPLVEIESGKTYNSVKEACIDNGLYWYDVVKSYIEETFVPITYQEFRMLNG